MGLVYSFLTKYNALRRPISSKSSLKLAELTTVVPVKVERDFMLNLLFQDERHINFSKGSKEFKTTFLKTAATTCPNLFFFKNRDKTKRGPLFGCSFRIFKQVVKPLVPYTNVRQMPSQTRRVLYLGEAQRFFLVIFMLHNFFLTPVSRFTLGLVHHCKLTPLVHYYFFYFKLVVYDFGFLSWGFEFYTPRKVLEYYEIFAEKSQRIQQMNKFYADGVLDFLNEEEFSTLIVPEEEADNTHPLIERPEVLYPDAPLLTTYARNELSNKSRYPRNRQTYRTGVLWCVWLTVFTIVLPSYLYYGIAVKFTYLWFAFISFIAGIVGAYYLRIKRWSVEKTTDLIERSANFLIK